MTRSRRVRSVSRFAFLAADPAQDELAAEVVMADLLGGQVLGLKEGVQCLVGAGSTGFMRTTR
ncbi:hypothetical protein ACFQVD_31105 [Streptosporangium amethystogenes subsp. fukuiense]|uniref:Uncharacterized protein n=1 Tax=Streptosporangium amethystogenes subsp. fukuiense TaxID=698418 RepID=A0ABW2T8G4_9ACTN